MSTYLVHYSHKEGFKLCNSSGPETFLNLIKFAKLSLTTSFHGTVFSVIFKKTFWFIDSDMHNPMDDRAATLVNQLGLPERLLLGEELIKKDFMQQPNYTHVNERIAQLQNQAKKFLTKALQ